MTEQEVVGQVLELARLGFPMRAGVVLSRWADDLLCAGQFGEVETMISNLVPVSMGMDVTFAVLVNTGAARSKLGTAWDNLAVRALNTLPWEEGQREDFKDVIGRWQTP